MDLPSQCDRSDGDEPKAKWSGFCHCGSFTVTVVAAWNPVFRVCCGVICLGLCKSGCGDIYPRVGQAVTGLLTPVLSLKLSSESEAGILKWE